MPEENGLGEAFRAYLEAGLSVLPTGLRSKRPAFGTLPVDPETGKDTFQPYRERYATPAEVADWLAKGAYPGILAGPISRNLKIYDFDDAEYSAWLLVNPFALELLRHTWTVRSGSGMIHVYLREYEYLPCPGQISLGPRKLGDVRLEGQYAIAPPSLHEDTGEPYVTLFGDPSSILTVPDSYDLMMKLARGFQASTSEGSDDEEIPESAGPNEIAPPVSAEARRRILFKLAHETGIPIRIKRAIREGVIPGEGEWALEQDRSKISTMIVAAMLEVGWSPVLIEAVLSTLPIGELVYRNSARRGSYGKRWLNYTIRRKQADMQARAQAVTQAKGTNFEVIKGEIQKWPDDALWVLEVKIDGRPGTSVIRAHEQDLKTYNGWIGVCMRQAHFFPLMQTGQVGQLNHHLFVLAVVNVCEATSPPPDATAEGRLQLAIREMAARDLYRERPSIKGQYTLGWKETSKDLAFIHGPTLTLRLVASKRPIPTDLEIHDALVALGATWVKTRIGERDEQLVGLWQLPLHVLTDEPSKNGVAH